jgi:transposase-like protein
MKKSKKKKDLKTDLGEELYERLKTHLYSKKPVLGEDSPFSELLQGMVNMMLEGELEDHLEEDKARGEVNKRNGKIDKQILTSHGPVKVSTPRDRQGSFEPQIVGKRQRQLHSGLDDQIIALYAQGNSIEDVKRLLLQIYGVEISAGKISQITDQVLPQIQAWRSRGLCSFYPVIYMDAIHFKVRQDGRYKSCAFYTVYSIDWEGNRDLLGLYTMPSEGASKWAIVLQDIKDRGVQDILVVCTDDLQGFSEAIESIYPAAIVQKCIVHQVRSSLKYVDEKDKKVVAKDLGAIYRSKTVAAAKDALEVFEKKWSSKYSYVVKQWRNKWGELMAFMDMPIQMRRMVYTTNPVEAVHRVMRKLVKSKAAWVSERALTKQLYLSLMQNQKSWKRRAYNWTSIQRELMALYPERVPAT